MSKVFNVRFPRLVIYELNGKTEDECRSPKRHCQQLIVLFRYKHENCNNDSHKKEASVENHEATSFWF